LTNGRRSLGKVGNTNRTRFWTLAKIRTVVAEIAGRNGIKLGSEWNWDLNVCETYGKTGWAQQGTPNDMRYKSVTGLTGEMWAPRYVDRREFDNTLRAS
jgi:hypothetical protein